MTRDERLRNRGAASRLLEKMNDMIRGRSYAKMVKDGRLDELHCEIVRLGWMVLTKSLRLTKVAGKMEMRVQLKLVDPDSEEAAQDGPFADAGDENWRPGNA